MNIGSPQDTLSEARKVMEITSWNPPLSADELNKVESELRVRFPSWLRLLYQACNGFLGPCGVSYLYRLDGDNGVLRFNTLIRSEDWTPSWVRKAIIFSDSGVGGALTTHWAALDGKLIEWCYADEGEYTVLPGGIIELRAREQAKWNFLSSDATK